MTDRALVHELRVPSKKAYGYTNVAFKGTGEEAIREQERLSEIADGIKEMATLFEKVVTFTGETILYDAVNHKYTDLEGHTLIGGSSYKKSLEAPFNTNKIAPLTAKKYGINVEDVKDMWRRNGEISSGLGTALHAAMEQYFLHKAHGTEKNYHLPKHPFLKEAVLSFPYKDLVAYPELFVSDVANKRVGQIDLLVPSENVEKEAKIIDYKSDAEIDKKIDMHFHQLSWYASILEAHGWKVSVLEVWNYTSEWKCYTSPVREIINKKIVA